MSSFSDDDDGPLGYSEISEKRKQNDKKAKEEQKPSSFLTPTKEEETTQGGSLGRSVMFSASKKQSKSPPLVSSEANDDPAIKSFLNDIQVEVLAPEPENRLIIKYYYIVEVRRNTATYRVRRSYSMFEWLYHRLILSNKGLIIPRIPEKNFRSNLPLAPPELLEERRVKFNRFLKRCLQKLKTWENPEDIYHFLRSEERDRGSFISYMITHPHSSKKPKTSIAHGLSKTKEAIWDKFQ